MIKGVGVDIIENERISDGIKAKLVERIFTGKERKFFDLHKMEVSHIAASFAAKEAVSKCLGTGFRGYSWKDIEILHEEQGKPYVVLHGNAGVIAKQLGIEKIFVSMSHGKKTTIAFAIAEGGFAIESSIKSSDERN